MQVKDIGVEQGRIGGDHLVAAIAGAHQCFQEFMPILQVKHRRLGFLQDSELFISFFIGELLCFQVLAS